MKQNFDNILLNKIKSIIRNEIGLGNESISISEIYDKLISAGVEVTEPAVAEILEKLEKEKLITVAPQENREGQITNTITWVSGKL
jgi:Mn-dependent DtxR family transcriptional regulator